MSSVKSKSFETDLLNDIITVSNVCLVNSSKSTKTEIAISFSLACHINKENISIERYLSPYLEVMKAGSNKTNR